MSLSNTMLSQNIKTYTHNSLAEKVYLQLDNEVYTTDKTIWFKAIIINAATHHTAYSSGVLYVDLIDQEQNIVNSKLIKIRDGIGDGHFDLDRSYKEGVYIIRAYTEWNKNFDSDFIFKKEIQVFSETENGQAYRPIQNIIRIDSNLTSQRFRANFHPKLLDSNHKKNLTVLVSQNNQRDTIVIKENKDKEYVFTFDISKESNLVELGFITDNGRQHKLSFSPQLNYLDLQFFPEGGQMINGLTSKIGFKAVGADGRGVFVEGDILDDNNNIVTSFRSNALGMGSFILENVDSTTKYKTVLNSTNKKSDKVFYLPEVLQSGYTLMVISKRDKLYVKAETKKSTNGSINVRLKGMCRGFEYMNEDVSLIDGSYIYVIPKHLFPDGVVAFTLFDNANNPVAERLFFNEISKKRLFIDAELKKDVFYQREKVNITISSQKEDNNPIGSNASILVVNRDNLGALNDNNQTILSYFLMNSDLRGPIENPGFYFRDGNLKDIDYLMLTQGWRRYKYHQPLRKLNYKHEKNLNVSGVIAPKNPMKTNDTIELMLMTFEKQRSMYTKNVAVPGSFEFQLNDMYGREQEIVIHPINNSETDKTDYRITLNKKTGLPVDFILNTISRVRDSLVQKIVAKNREFKNKKDEYYFNTFGTTKLDEIVIDGYKMTPIRKKVVDNYGRPNAVINGDELKAVEGELSTGLYSVLFSSNFRDKIVITRGRTGNLYAKTANGGKGHTTLFLVDGEPVNKVNLPMLQYLQIDEIRSVEVIDNAKKLKKLYSIVMSSSPPYGRFEGSIVAIYTRSGRGLYGAIRTSDEKLELNTMPVFSVEKEFYTPKHDSNHYYDIANPDFRSTIFWKPQLLTDHLGNASVAYYHSDNTGTFQIIIEAISETGEIGYKIVNYNVEERTN